VYSLLLRKLCNSTRIEEAIVKRLDKEGAALDNRFESIMFKISLED